MKLPYKVKRGTHILSTGNELKNLCQKSDTIFEAPVEEVTITVPARSLNTFIFMIDNGEEDAIKVVKADGKGMAQSAAPMWYDLQGRPLSSPRGLYIERRADGTTRKVLAPMW